MQANAVVANAQNAQNAQHIEELVWRKGDERCERSYREMPKVTTLTTVPTEKKALEATQEPEKTPSWDIQDARSFTHNNAEMGVEGGNPLNRREEANSKINERYLIGQSIHNPFMPNNNYANDIEVQMNFLTPNKG